MFEVKQNSKFSCSNAQELLEKIKTRREEIRVEKERQEFEERERLYRKIYEKLVQSDVVEFETEEISDILVEELKSAGFGVKKMEHRYHAADPPHHTYIISLHEHIPFR